MQSRKDDMKNDASALWATPVNEYMSKSLLSVPPEASLDDVQRLLASRDISAVPVIDGEGALCGIVSTSDLLREASLSFSSAGRVTSFALPARTAADVMRRQVFTVDGEAPLSAAAKAMVAAKVHRLVVLRHGAPAGIISTRDAMRAILFHHVDRPLSSIMSRPILGVDIGDTIEDAVERLAEANVHGLVVLDGRRPVGLFTQREAIQARALPPSLRALPVEGVMSYELLGVDASTPLYRVAGHAIQTRVRRIFAVEKGEIVGIVTGFDVVRVMTEAEL